MRGPSEEMLMAYADNALNADEMAKIEAFLATDGAARDMVEMFRRTRDLSMAFAEPITTPAPPHLVDAVLNSKLRYPAETPRSSRMPSSSGWRGVIAPMALAASAAFVIGLGVGMFSTFDPAEQTQAVLSPGKLGASDALTKLLETLPSGASVQLSGPTAARAAVLTTFRDQNKRPCRDIEVFSSGGQNYPDATGVACRETDGSWSVEGAVRVGASKSTGSQYSPAGSQDSRALDGVLTSIGAGTAISSGEESALIARGWREP